MPKYRLTVEKFMPLASEYWTNVYWCNAADLLAAMDIGNLLVAAERPITSPAVTITKVRVDDGLPNTTEGGTVMHNVQGTRDMGGGQLVPLFVVGRVDFSVIGGGRPSRKFMRGSMGEVDGDFMTLSNSYKSELQNYGNAVVTAGVCDVDGQLFSFAAVHPTPAMRQLRRGSKKKLAPSSGGIPL